MYQLRQIFAEECFFFDLPANEKGKSDLEHNIVVRESRPEIEKLGRG